MNWQGVCIHHSATIDSATSSWEAIRRYHVHTNGWSEIGYHFGLEAVAGSLRTRIGRPLNLPGAHTPPLNRSHIGLVVIGDFDRELPSQTRINYLALLLADLFRFYGWPLNDNTLRYHRDVDDRTCPGELFPPKSVLIDRVQRCLRGELLP